MSLNISRLPSYSPRTDTNDVQIRNGIGYRRINGATEILPGSIPANILDKEICILSHAGTVTCNNGVRTIVAFDPSSIFVSYYDPKQMFLNRHTDNNRIYAKNPTAGRYRATAWVEWQANTNGSYRTALITDQTSTSTASQYYAGGRHSVGIVPLIGYAYNYVEWVGTLSSGNNDFICLGLEHDHSASVNVTAVRFSLERIE